MAEFEFDNTDHDDDGPARKKQRKLTITNKNIIVFGEKIPSLKVNFWTASVRKDQYYKAYCKVCYKELTARILNLRNTVPQRNINKKLMWSQQPGPFRND